MTTAKLGWVERVGAQRKLLHPWSRQGLPAGFPKFRRQDLVREIINIGSTWSKLVVTKIFVSHGFGNSKIFFKGTSTSPNAGSRWKTQFFFKGTSTSPNAGSKQNSKIFFKGTSTWPNAGSIQKIHEIQNFSLKVHRPHPMLEANKIQFFSLKVHRPHPMLEATKFKIFL
jgi:hypothetical protein